MFENKYQHHLDEEGYVIIKNFYQPSEIEDIKRALNTNTKKVNYSYLHEKVNNIIYPKLRVSMNWYDPISGKWRFSNKNNSTDAGFFHRDVKYYNHKEIPNVYTVLTYMDTGDMELVPKSHKKGKLSFTESLNIYKTKMSVKMNPGDLLIIHSNILHRGVFHTVKNNKHRRLLQLFNVCKTKEDFDKYHKNCYNISYEEDSIIVRKLIYIMVEIQKFYIIQVIAGYFVYLASAMRSLLAHICMIPKNKVFLKKKSMLCTSPTPATKKNIDNENYYYFNKKFMNIK